MPRTNAPDTGNEDWTYEIVSGGERVDGFVLYDVRFWTSVERQQDGLGSHIIDGVRCDLANNFKMQLRPDYRHEQVEANIERYIDVAQQAGWEGDRRGTTLNLQVGTSADDGLGRQNDITSWGTGTGLGRVGRYNATNSGYAGLSRFINVTIPRDSTIDAATITVRANGSRTGTTCNGYIDALDADNATMPTSYDNYRAQARTAASVAWSAIPAWTHLDDQTTPEIKTVIQEIVDRGGWSTGNALLILIHDEAETSSSPAYRDWYSYDGSASAAAKLDITYTEGTDRTATGASSFAALTATGTGVQTQTATGASSFASMTATGSAIQTAYLASGSPSFAAMGVIGSAIKTPFFEHQVVLGIAVQNSHEVVIGIVRQSNHEVLTGVLLLGDHTVVVSAALGVS